MPIHALNDHKGKVINFILTLFWTGSGLPLYSVTGGGGGGGALRLTLLFGVTQQ